MFEATKSQQRSEMFVKGSDGWRQRMAEIVTHNPNAAATIASLLGPDELLQHFDIFARLVVEVGPLADRAEKALHDALKMGRNVQTGTTSNSLGKDGSNNGS